MTTATGTDIVSVARIARIIETRGARFLNRWFTPAEIAYCSGMAHPNRHFAARLAAKEAVFKALPASPSGPVPWRCIEIVHDEHGAPAVRLFGPLAGVAEQAGLGPIHVSLSHCDDFATAVAIVEDAPLVE